MHANILKTCQSKRNIHSKHIMHERQKARACIGKKDKKTKRNSMQLKKRLANLSMVAIEARHL